MLQPAQAPPGGVIKVLDLGLARLSIAADVPTTSVTTAHRASAPLTAAGAVMGTADYIAPEQATDPRGADIRADVYSLGCTLFHLLTGRPPFTGRTVTEKLAGHAATPLPLSTLGRDVPAGVAAVIERMTAKDPADRYATPAEVALALAPFRPAGPRPRVVRRRFATVLVLAAAALLVTAVLWRPRTNVPGQSEPAADPQRAGPTEEEAFEVVRKLGGWARRDDFNHGVAGVRVKLSDTRATDADLRVAAAFKHLTQLYLAQTPITGTGLKHLTGQAHLTTLGLTGTRVTDDALKHVGELKQLETLELQSTPVTDAGMKHLAGLTKLQTLSLFGTQVSDAGMSDVGRLRNLSSLSLDQTGIGDAGLRRLEGLADLKYLGLFYTRRISDEGMKCVARLHKLQGLDLCGTRVTDRGMRELARLTALTSLRLGGLKVTDAGLQALAGLSDLHSIDLSGTDVTDEGLREVVKHPTLTHVDLQTCMNVTDAGMKVLAGLPELTTLSLDGTGVTDAGLAELARCPKLTSLRLFKAARVTDAGVARLRDARPGLTIHR
jgi:internalin A